jgi:hypothetical protein
MIYKPKKYIIQIRALSSGANNRWIFIKDEAKHGERLFRKTRMGIFGDVFNIFDYSFGRFFSGWSRMVDVVLWMYGTYKTRDVTDS